MMVVKNIIIKITEGLNNLIRHFRMFKIKYNKIIWKFKENYKIINYKYYQILIQKSINHFKNYKKLFYKINNNKRKYTKFNK
jgi:hypothetical protein